MSCDHRAKGINHLSIDSNKSIDSNNFSEIIVKFMIQGEVLSKSITSGG